MAFDRRTVRLLGGNVGVPPSSVQPQVRALNLQARQLYLAGNVDGANSTYQQARSLAASSSDPSYFSDDFAYTEQILAGDQQAAADSKAGTALESAGQANQPSAAEKAFGDTFSDNTDPTKKGKTFSDTLNSISSSMRSLLPSWLAPTPRSGREASAPPLPGTNFLKWLAIGAVGVVVLSQIGTAAQLAGFARRRNPLRAKKSRKH